MKKTIVTAVIFLGVIGLAINTIFNWSTFTFLYRYTIPTGQTLYRLDIWGYIENIRNSFSTTGQLTLQLPTRQWDNLSTDFWAGLGNNLALMLDWILFAINVMTYNFKIGGYIVLQLLAVLGVNTVQPNSAGGLQWLVTVAQFLRDLSIAYI